MTPGSKGFDIEVLPGCPLYGRGDTATRSWLLCRDAQRSITQDRERSLRFFRGEDALNYLSFEFPMELEYMSIRDVAQEAP